MIQVFDVMASLGSGNPRAMADGVSAATIPTLAGMVVSISAIPFATHLPAVTSANCACLASAWAMPELRRRIGSEYPDGGQFPFLR